MLTRIVTWLFYAIVFFVLGAWTCSHTTGVRGFLQSGADAGLGGFQRVQNWALGTITPKPGAPAWKGPSILEIARSAYARGDISVAISAYQEILKESPDNLDARGELGNVLFSSGRLQEAAEVYHATAQALIAKGEIDRARALVPAIRRGNAGLATEIERSLAQPVPPAKRSEAPKPDDAKKAS